MTINLEVRQRKGETAERLIKRFIKKVKKEKILEKYREKMTYKKPSEIRREKKKRWQREIKKLKEEQEK